MPRYPTISTAKTVEIYREAISVRRDFCEDDEFFKMSDFWRFLCDEDSNWKIKEYPGKELSPDKRKAGVIAFGDALTLLVDRDLVRDADRGCRLSNFTLGHEAAHVMLGHHENSRVVKNFTIFDGPNGKTTRPPNVEELEAHYGAVFLQCGVLIRDQSFDAIDLAKRSHSDFNYVKRLRQLTCLEVFERELRNQSQNKGRVIL